MADRQDVLLDIKGLKKYFPIHQGFFRKVVGHVKAVDGVDLAVKAGETVAVRVAPSYAMIRLCSL